MHPTVQWRNAQLKVETLVEIVIGTYSIILVVKPTTFVHMSVIVSSTVQKFPLRFGLNPKSKTISLTIISFFCKTISNFENLPTYPIIGYPTVRFDPNR